MISDIILYIIGAAIVFVMALGIVAIVKEVRNYLGKGDDK